MRTRVPETAGWARTSAAEPPTRTSRRRGAEPPAPPCPRPAESHGEPAPSLGPRRPAPKRAQPTPEPSPRRCSISDEDDGEALSGLRRDAAQVALWVRHLKVADAMSPTASPWDGDTYQALQSCASASAACPSGADTLVGILPRRPQRAQPHPVRVAGEFVRVMRRRPSADHDPEPVTVSEETSLLDAPDPAHDEVRPSLDRDGRWSASHDSDLCGAWSTCSPTRMSRSLAAPAAGRRSRAAFATWDSRAYARRFSGRWGVVPGGQAQLTLALLALAGRARARRGRGTRSSRPAGGRALRRDVYASEAICAAPGAWLDGARAFEWDPGRLRSRTRLRHSGLLPPPAHVERCGAGGELCRVARKACSSTIRRGEPERGRTAVRSARLEGHAALHGAPDGDVRAALDAALAVTARAASSCCPCLHRVARRRLPRAEGLWTFGLRRALARR